MVTNNLDLFAMLFFIYEITNGLFRFFKLYFGSWNLMESVAFDNAIFCKFFISKLKYMIWIESNSRYLHSLLYIIKTPFNMVQSQDKGWELRYQNMKTSILVNVSVNWCLEK